MLNLEQFEENVYAAVTKELNELVAEVASKSDCIHLHTGILRALNKINEEIMIQILHGILFFQAAGFKETKDEQH